MHLIDEFLENRNVVLILEDVPPLVQLVQQASIDVVDGVLTHTFYRTARHDENLQAEVRAHDVGHVIAATDEELFLPNLGLLAVENPRDLALEQIGFAQQREWTAILTQARFAAEDPNVAGKPDRIFRAARIFHFDRNKLLAAFSGWTMGVIANRFDAQLEKIRAHSSSG